VAHLSIRFLEEPGFPLPNAAQGVHRIRHRVPVYNCERDLGALHHPILVGHLDHVTVRGLVDLFDHTHQLGFSKVERDRHRY
jgi:hypothetical protein